jgi:hypothetical protein
MWLEWFRLTKRLAAWGVFFAFLALQIVFYGGRYYNARDGRGEYWGSPRRSLMFWRIEPRSPRCSPSPPFCSDAKHR